MSANARPRPARIPWFKATVGEDVALTQIDVTELGTEARDVVLVEKLFVGSVLDNDDLVVEVVDPRLVGTGECSVRAACDACCGTPRRL